MILDTHDTGSKSYCNEVEGSKVEKLSLFLNVGNRGQRQVSKDFYVVGNLEDRGKRRCSILSINKKGM